MQIRTSEYSARANIFDWGQIALGRFRHDGRLSNKDRRRIERAYEELNKPNNGLPETTIENQGLAKQVLGRILSGSYAGSRNIDRVIDILGRFSRYFQHRAQREFEATE